MSPESPTTDIDDQSTAFARSIFARLQSIVAEYPFRPHQFFSKGHAQTLAAYAWPRRYRLRKAPLDNERIFEVAPDTKVIANCRWQTEPQSHPTVVTWHGMEGSTSSIYMIAIADKAFRAGFNVVRVNYRNCGGAEHLAKTLYHGGLTEDLRAVINELITTDQLPRLYVLGFSLGGNMVLKLGGEYGSNPPRQVMALAAVSPSVDLNTSTALVMEPSNWLYNKRFVRSLKERIRVKHKLFPELYDLAPLEKIKSIRDFDEAYTSLANGFRNADDYYQKASSVFVAKDIRLPTLLIHSLDDPFIPFAPLQSDGFVENPYILTIVTEGGGHVAFISRDVRKGEDRFWAENRVVDFFKIVEDVTRDR